MVLRDSPVRACTAGSRKRVLLMIRPQSKSRHLRCLNAVMTESRLGAEFHRVSHTGALSPARIFGISRFAKLRPMLRALSLRDGFDAASMPAVFEMSRR